MESSLSTIDVVEFTMSSEDDSEVEMTKATSESGHISVSSPAMLGKNVHVLC